MQMFCFVAVLPLAAAVQEQCPELSLEGQQKPGKSDIWPTFTLGNMH